MKILPIKTGSQGNFYLITTNKNNRFLIECGLTKLNIIKALNNLGLNISDFEGCFVSHSHKDHCESLEWVAKYMPIFSNSNIKEKYKTTTNVFSIPPAKVYSIKDLKVIPFNVEHGMIENYGYMFKDETDTMLFITDFRECYSNIFNNIFTEIFIECNWTKNLIEDYATEIKENRQINTHCSLELTAYFLSKLNLEKCRKITLIHPSNDYCDKRLCLKTLRDKIPNIEIDFAENLI